MEPERPDYAGGWIGGILPALLSGDHPTWLPDPVRAADAVLVLVLDGLGWHALQAHPQHVPTLAGMAGGAVTTTVPSTTATALTSISTGLPPSRHGVVGYRMRVGGQLLNVLRWQGPEGWAPDPEVVQPIQPFQGAEIPVVTRAEFRDSGFTLAHLRGAPFIGWQTTSVLVEHCRRLASPRHRLLYAYYDGIDRTAHAYGLRDGFFTAELAAADRLVADLLDVLGEEWALLVTADHGQVQVPPSGIRTLDPLARYVGHYSGEARFRSLHARAGRARELVAAASETFSDDAWVFSREQLFDEGWLGDAASAEVRGRVGDVVLAARRLVGFADPGNPNETRMLGYHGSLSAEEMLVPLLAARGRREP